MRNQRQDAILDLIQKNNVETQQELTELLSAVGFEVTQATVSRDIKELGLHKKANSAGCYVYTSNSPETKDAVSDEMTIILSKCLTSIDYSLNTVVIKTLSGMAQGAASVLDAMQLPECLGTIAGDDTIFVVTRGEDASQKFCNRLKNLIN